MSQTTTIACTDTFLSAELVPFLIREDRMPETALGFVIVHRQDGPNLEISLKGGKPGKMEYTGPEAKRVRFPPGSKMFFNHQGKLVQMSLADGSHP